MLQQMLLSPDISHPQERVWSRHVTVALASGVTGKCSYVEQLDVFRADFPQPPKINMSGTHSEVAMEKPMHGLR